MRYEVVLDDYNITANYAYNLLQQMYDEGLINKSNPIDEYPEMMWYYIWHHDGRRWRMGASMMGPDYTHWQGAVDTVMDKLGKMINWYETQKRIKSFKTSTQVSMENVNVNNNEMNKNEVNDLIEKDGINRDVGMALAVMLGLSSVALVKKFKK